MRSINLAILSSVHLHANAWVRVVSTMDDARIAAVWDDDGDRGIMFAQKAGADFVPDLEGLLSRAEIDAVAIASQTSKHAELAVAAAKAGKHIMCEKPMAVTLDDCDRIIEAVKQAGVKYYQIFPMRWDPVNQKIREIIQSGALGRISMIRKRHGHFYGIKWQKTDPDIWFTKSEPAGAGAFLDEGIHAIDWMRWIFGEPVSVTAQIDTVGSNYEVDDVGVAIYRFHDKSMMALHASWLDQAAEITTEIYGSKGTIIQYYTDGASNRNRSEDRSPLKVYWAEAGDWETFDFPVHFPRNQEAVVAPFIDCIVRDVEPPVTMWDGRRSLELALAAYQSARTNKTISIPDAGE